MVAVPNENRMKQIPSIDDVYPILDELIVEIKEADQSHLAAILHHRLHEVAWTTCLELFEELRNRLTKAVQSDDPKLPEQLKVKAELILRTIDVYLNSEA
jgi:hypothetical protein